MDLILNAGEMKALFRQDPATEKDGSWQSRLLEIFGRHLGPKLDGLQKQSRVSLAIAAPSFAVSR